ncbi:unnamed protein product [Bursaphelenchus xylophilus]|nr:unnamed protein product [Bursaphelenchus xylophilus]CAG9113132.1 unnamed protein product [Bursaphelenchus xylophilus]
MIDPPVAWQPIWIFLRIHLLPVVHCGLIFVYLIYSYYNIGRKWKGKPEPNSLRDQRIGVSHFFDPKRRETMLLLKI